MRRDSGHEDYSYKTQKVGSEDDQFTEQPSNPSYSVRIAAEIVALQRMKPVRMGGIRINQ